MSVTKKAESTADREIVITRLIDAPVARVWRAWTDNDEIVKWWGPHGFSDETRSREFKPGGIWKHTMIGPDGVKYLNTAKYVEIVENEKIVVKNGGGKEFDEKGVGFVATITFKAVGNKTELTMRSEFMTAAMKKQAVEEFRAIEGGQQTLARLNAHVTGQFVIFRLVDAPRERVWRAWTEPEEMAAWFGPKGSETTHAKLDFRVGGSYHYAMKTGGVELWGLALYKEIVKPEKLVYMQQFSDKDRGLGIHPLAPTWPKKTLTTVLLQDFGPKTLISLYWLPVDASAVELETFAKGMDGMKGGWGGSFDRLDAHLKENPMRAESTVKVLVTHRFEFPPERVFDAWLDAKQAGKWLFATPTGTMVKAQVDPRVGGRYVFIDRRDGEDVEHTGEYLVIDRPHRLVFTFSVPQFSKEATRVAIDIVARGSGCELTLTHEGVLLEYADRTQGGWSNILAGLETALQGEKP